MRHHLVILLKEKLSDKLLVCGAYLAWIDTTLVAKVQGKMPGVQKWKDHSGNPDRGEHLIGHHWALAGLIGATFIAKEWNPMCFPLLANLIPGNTNPFGFAVSPNGVAQAMTFWDVTCPMVTQLALMLENQPLRVVVDAYFAKAPFINWMLIGIPFTKVHVITRMRKDAVAWDDPEPETPLPPGKKKLGRKPTRPRKGREWKLASLVKSFTPESVTVFVYGKIKTFSVVSRDVWVRDITVQKVRVVVIQTIGEPVILLSTDLTMTSRQIILIYAMRFSCELGIRDAKQHFGFGDYQCTSFLAMTRFVGLSLISFCLWRLSLVSDMDGEWLQTQDKASALSFNRIRRAAIRFVIQQVFRNSASGANLQNFEITAEELLRMIS